MRMRTTITIDDHLFEEATRTTGASSASDLVRIALEKLIAAESRKRLLALGGAAPDFEVPGRSSVRNPTNNSSLGLVAEEAANYGDKG